VGNLIDRLRLGKVIDFIDLHWYHFSLAAFNVADSAISIGVVVLFVQMLRKGSLTLVKVGGARYWLLVRTKGTAAKNNDLVKSPHRRHPAKSWGPETS